MPLAKFTHAPSSRAISEFVLVDQRSEDTRYAERVSAEPDQPVPSSMPFTNALSAVDAIARSFAEAAPGCDLTVEFGIRLDPEVGAIVCGNDTWRHFTVTCAADAAKLNGA
jgi:hypothetical protein